MSVQMQANFDRLFATFDSRGVGADAPRKAPRTDDLRGGALSRRVFAAACFWHISELAHLRGGASMGEKDIDDLELDSANYHVMFCNPATHRGHLDRMMEYPF
eukprot:3718526-Amphidinium_carterae.1